MISGDEAGEESGDGVIIGSNAGAAEIEDDDGICANDNWRQKAIIIIAISVVVDAIK